MRIGHKNLRLPRTTIPNSTIGSFFTFTPYSIALQDPNIIDTDHYRVVIKYLPNESILLVEGNKSNIKLPLSRI